MINTLPLPELLAPAGDWECLKAAVENGADAVYFGLDRFNARMRAENFTVEDLPEVMAYLHRRGVKGYVTFNTLVFADELTAAEAYIRQIIGAGCDAAIVQDIGICRLIRSISPDFPIHGSTQMTITSSRGVAFAQHLGCHLVVLARECSISEINQIRQTVDLPLEVFVHGALCVAYSGQCLTSEALGGRSANRGECAQACRMPYDLVADGALVPLGDKKYLLSPQDLAGIEVLPELVASGVRSLKIEGRLKSAEYVANVTHIYRAALDRIADQQDSLVPEEDLYALAMSFSRGLSTGWFEGIDNQALVHARFGKKRGVLVGEVLEITAHKVLIRLAAPIRLAALIKPGDGVVFDQGHPDQSESGGRVYEVSLHGNTALLGFGRGDVDVKRLHPGDLVWKTSDPELDRRVRQSYSGDQVRYQRPLAIRVCGSVDQPLVLILRDEEGHQVQVQSTECLLPAHTHPLTTAKLQDQLGRLGNTPFYLGTLSNELVGEVLLPVSVLNRLRREAVLKLEAARTQPRQWRINAGDHSRTLPPLPRIPENTGELTVLVRDLVQLDAALNRGISRVYCDFEDPRRYREALKRDGEIWLATPRIIKSKEDGLLQQLQTLHPAGYLVRNYDSLTFFQGAPCRGDFSLNVANPLTAKYFMDQFDLTGLTASYDLNIQQLEALLTSVPASWFEVTIHQHMPMFHMEHCVFCAFLSTGTDYTNCGRPCETHEVRIRDRVGSEHVLKADVGCRNTVFNSRAQTGAEYAQRLIQLGVGSLRIEFVQESASEVQRVIRSYQQLLSGAISGRELWHSLQLQHQLGVTRGSF